MDGSESGDDLLFLAVIHVKPLVIRPLTNAGSIPGG